MKFFILILALLATSFDILAAGSINFLEVDNDVVLFSTSETKTATSPACVATDSADLWTVSLASDSGRAIYSLILTSMAKGDGVALNIESAQDCADKSGLERARKVNLAIAADTAEIEGSSNQGSTIGFYAGDGVTRLGTVLEMGDDIHSWYYVDYDNSTEIKVHYNKKYIPSDNYTIYFEDENCSGSDYVNGSAANLKIINKAYNDGNLLDASNIVVNKSIHSELRASGQCTNYSSARTKSVVALSTTTYTIPVCGTKRCIVKVD